MAHFPTFARPGTRLMPPPVDPARARLSALRLDLVAYSGGHATTSPAAMILLRQEIAQLERATRATFESR
jgi:hypothetical protein